MFSPNDDLHKVCLKLFMFNADSLPNKIIMKIIIELLILSKYS